MIPAMSKAIIKLSEMLSSTKFVIIQEGLLLGSVAAILKTIFEKFPLDSFYVFIGPIVLGVYGLRTWSNIKGGKDDSTNGVDLGYKKQVAGFDPGSAPSDLVGLQGLRSPRA
jgi:hypothetical protein